MTPQAPQTSAPQLPLRDTMWTNQGTGSGQANLGTMTRAWIGAFQTISALAQSAATLAQQAFAAIFVNPMTALGDLLYGGAAGIATRLAGNITATPMALMQTGTGLISTAPSWVDPTTICSAIGFPGSYANLFALAQTGTLATANIRHAGVVLPAGMYQILFNLEMTPTGSVTLAGTFSYTDPVLGAQTFTFGFSAFTTPGLNQAVYVATTDGIADLTVGIVKSGAGTVVYTFRAVVAKLV